MFQLDIVKFFIKKFKVNSIFVRNAIITILLISVLLGCISAFFIYYLTSMYKSEVKQTNISNLSRVIDVNDSIIKEMGFLANTILLKDDVSLFMTTPSYSSIQKKADEQIKSYINAYALIYNYVDSIIIYSDINKYVISNRTYCSYDMFDDKGWIDYYNSNDSKDIYFISRKRNNVYQLYRNIKQNCRPFWETSR